MELTNLDCIWKKKSTKSRGRLFNQLKLCEFQTIVDNVFISFRLSTKFRRSHVSKIVSEFLDGRRWLSSNIDKIWNTRPFYFIYKPLQLLFMRKSNWNLTKTQNQKFTLTFFCYSIRELKYLQISLLSNWSREKMLDRCKYCCSTEIFDTYFLERATESSWCDSNFVFLPLMIMLLLEI